MSARPVGFNAAVTATYDEQDRILAYGTATYKHDNHGDLSSRVDGAKSLALTYDELGNLTKSIVKDGSVETKVEYVVDGLGRRVARRVNGQFDRAWLYRDALRPVSEVDANGVFTHFVYASNSAESGAPIALIRAGVLYRVVKDQIGSVRFVVNATNGKDSNGFAGQQGNYYLYVNGDPVNGVAPKGMDVRNE